MKNSEYFKLRESINEKNSLNYKKLLDGILNIFGVIQSRRDPYIQNHSLNVTEISLDIAEKLNHNIDEKIDIEFLRYGALLHDFGKIFIPESILNKPTLLNEVERKTIQLHTTIAYNVFEEAISNYKNFFTKKE
ncbi:MAG: HD-GYP domain-containing protein [Candidatus Woesearchaeota archaeon]